MFRIENDFIETTSGRTVYAVLSDGDVDVREVLLVRWDVNDDKIQRLARAVYPEGADANATRAAREKTVRIVRDYAYWLSEHALPVDEEDIQQQLEKRVAQLNVARIGHLRGAGREAAKADRESAARAEAETQQDAAVARTGRRRTS